MLHQLTIHEAAAWLRSGQVTAVELTGAVLDRILAVDNDIKSYLTLTPELALEQAAEADAALAAARESRHIGRTAPADRDPAGDQGRDHGGGRAIDRRVAAFWKAIVPPYNATVVENLRAAGAVILGKTNTDEFAMGSSTENSAYFTTHNPWDLSRVPGGSSGGSAAAVAADECLGALGSDTGGSVRQPASFCGVVGVKPTYGRVSPLRAGRLRLLARPDRPLRQKRDRRAILLGAVAGHDPRDSTSVDLPVPDYLAGHASHQRCAEPSGVRGCASACRRNTSSKASSPRSRRPFARRSRRCTTWAPRCARSACRTPTWRCRSTT